MCIRDRDLALYLSATKTNHDLEAALKLMQNYDPSMLCGLVQLLTSQEACLLYTSRCV